MLNTPTAVTPDGNALRSPLAPMATFSDRHIGPNAQEIQTMLQVLGVESLDSLMDQAVPQEIRLDHPLDLPPAQTETQALETLKAIAQKNQVYRSHIGMGYYPCHTPGVIQRNILENPGWYTAYTPYQAEIAQGRLEALLNYQTMVTDLTGLEIANASLLDEGTAAAEAMAMAYDLSKSKAQGFFVDQGCHPQTIEVLQTRAQPLGIEVIIGNYQEFTAFGEIFGALVQYPNTQGTVADYGDFTAQVHEHRGLVTVATDLLALTLLTPPGEWGADLAIGNSQRFGVPLGFGGPHAAFLATRKAFQRKIPGRIVGVSKDAQGNPALRLALQTREQHIRREKATSNICTAQVLLAVIASMYGVYHGPEGLKNIALRVHQLTVCLAQGLRDLGYAIAPGVYFDTVKITVTPGQQAQIRQRAQAQRLNLRYFDQTAIGISLDETVTLADVQTLWDIFDLDRQHPEAIALPEDFPVKLGGFGRTTDFLTAPVFNCHHSETELLRYIQQLQNKDISLTTSMIPLGSCTMKLNATAEMQPITWPEFNAIHPYAPQEQTQGYQILCSQLEAWLGEITGFAGVSLQPNAGSQGEYAGLQVIRQYHRHRGQGDRHICLIPESAHGTNPASAVMCGMEVVVVKCQEQGDIDFADLQAKAEKHSEQLAALMVTYPSTHGVFEEGIQDICNLIHGHGGQVYLDGANLNAQVGICRPGDYGADVCHLNLHKTFCIPHGGGGPGVGPIGVAAHLVPFLPKTDLADHPEKIGLIAAAPWGSASILPISWMYIAMMGDRGLTKATAVAILNANYMAQRLQPHYPVLYRGRSGWVAHECIIDLRPLRKLAGITVEDIAKRLIDYGFHAPTVSWPVAGTMMIEPTESESLEELDRFCDAMVAIGQEVQAIAHGKYSETDNPVKNAPHPAAVAMADHWPHSYSRTQAVYPLPWVKDRKFWAPVARIDNAYGDRNLVCSCGGMDSYQ